MAKKLLKDDREDVEKSLRLIGAHCCTKTSSAIQPFKAGALDRAHLGSIRELG